MYRLIAKTWLVLLLICVQATAQQYGIIPGRSIGLIEIGMSRQTVHSKLGRPSGTYNLPGRGYRGDYWFSRDNSNTLRIFYDRNGRVYQISATSISFSTPEGITTSSSLVEVKRQHPNLQVLRMSKRGDIDYYYDRRRGVAFEFTERLKDDGSVMRMHAILVFKPGGQPQPEPDELVRED
jgi:hypothetical protein